MSAAIREYPPIGSREYFESAAYAHAADSTRLLKMGAGWIDFAEQQAAHAADCLRRAALAPSADLLIAESRHARAGRER